MAAARKQHREQFADKRHFSAAERKARLRHLQEGCLPEPPAAAAPHICPILRRKSHRTSLQSTDDGAASAVAEARALVAGLTPVDTGRTNWSFRVSLAAASLASLPSSVRATSVDWGPGTIPGLAHMLTANPVPQLRHACTCSSARVRGRGA